MEPYVVEYRRKCDLLHHGLDFDLGKACVNQQLLKLIRRVEGMLAAFDLGCIRPKDAIKRQYKCVRTRSSLYRTVDAECDAARWRQHSANFAERAALIWKELQSLLTKNQVKLSCREWQIERTCLDPIDRRSLADSV